MVLVIWCGPGCVHVWRTGCVHQRLTRVHCSVTTGLHEISLTPLRPVTPPLMRVEPPSLCTSHGACPLNTSTLGPRLRHTSHWGTGANHLRAAASEAW